MRVDSNLQALNAFGVDMAVSANNIANVNTNEFEARNVQLESGPDGNGVNVASIYPDHSPGALIPAQVEVENPDTGQISAEYQMVESSNTDLAREFVNMNMTQRAYEANAVAIRTYDDMLGSLINEIV